MNKKDIATDFLNMASSGQVRQAFEKHVHSDFKHHNPFFKGDRESLLIAMEENAQDFPNKTYESLRAIEELDLVAVHGKVAMSEDSQWSVIHIFRFEGDKIIETWEAAQELMDDIPNENGIL